MKKTHITLLFTFLFILLVMLVVMVIPTSAAEEISENNATKTLYRYREKVEWTTNYPLEAPWELISRTSSTKLYLEFNKLNPKELANTEEKYSAEHYYVSKVSDGSCVKYTTNPHGTGVAYYFDKALTDYGMYSNDYTYSLHPTTGVKIYYSGVYTTYTAVVYTKYEYNYWKWSDWSAWSETPCVASETIEVETKESDILYRYRERKTTTSKTMLSEPWVLYDITTEYEHSGMMTVTLKSSESIDSSYCVHKREYVNKYVNKYGNTFYLTTQELIDYTSRNPSPTPVTDGSYRRYTYCTKKNPYDLYHYQVYGDWSDWSYTPVEESEKVQVQTIEAIVNVFYDANGGTGAPSATTKAYNEYLELSMVIPKRENHKFLGWSTSPNGKAEYGAGGVYLGNTEVTFYAVWKNVTEYTVSYDVNGGNGAFSQQCKLYGESVTLSDQTPVREGYLFLGWATDRKGAPEYFVGDTYDKNENLTLYAIWKLHSHTWNDGTITKEPTCTSVGGKTYVCSGCYAAKDEEIPKLSHSFTRKTMTSTYKKSDATCTEKEVYYYSCANCGEKGTSTFEIGSALGHTGGVSGCAIRAKCTRCGQEYGDFGNHYYTSQTVDDKYLKSLATCMSPALYYKNCFMCGKAGTSTFEHGTKIGHSYTEKSTDEKYLVSEASCTDKAEYYYSCTMCKGKGTKTFEYGSILGHTGGTATCTAKAKCTRCGQVYGALGSHNYDVNNWGYKSKDGHAHICLYCGGHDTLRSHVPNVSSATELTAKYCTVYGCGYILEEKVYNDYTITFVDYDGSILSTAKYHYGDTIEEIGSPTRRADKTYTYSFAGWDKKIGTCVGDETFTATYTATYIEYTVVFKNYDGNILSTQQYHYGDVVKAPATPQKPSDEHYYSFVGWDKSVTSCLGNAIYTAKFTNKVLPVASVANASARAGEIAVLNIVISGAPELESLAISGVEYDRYALELVAFEWKTSESVLSNWDKSLEKGAVAYTSAVDINGIVASLTFKVKEHADEGDYAVACVITAKECDFKNTFGKISVCSMLLGDLDANEAIDKDDAIYLLMHTFFPEDYPIEQPSDFDGNGTVDKDDAIYLLMYTFFPEDYPLAPVPAAMAVNYEIKKKDD